MFMKKKNTNLIICRADHDIHRMIDVTCPIKVTERKQEPQNDDDETTSNAKTRIKLKEKRNPFHIERE